MTLFWILLEILNSVCVHKAPIRRLPYILCDASSALQCTRTILSASSLLLLLLSHTESNMWGIKVLCLASILVQVKMGKLVLVIFAEHHYQVSPLPVESSLPPINWDNIKAK